MNGMKRVILLIGRRKQSKCLFANIKAYPQQIRAHDVETTSYQGQCYVMPSKLRSIKVDAT